MIDYPALRAVSSVARTGSFEKTAQLLGVTPSAVSQRVKQMEERLGTVLIVRGAPCRATEAGEWLCRHAEQVGLLERALFEHLPGLARDGEAERVTIPLATSADSLGTWFLPALAPFSQRSDLLLDIVLDDQDHTADWLRRGRVLAAVTGLDRPVQGCRLHRLGALRYRATASPAFLARHFPGGVTEDALARAPTITYNQKDRLQTRWIEAAFGSVLAPPTHWLPSTQGFVEACRLGLGWAMNPADLADPLIASGALVELVGDSGLDVPLYWQVNRLAAERLDELTTSIVETARRVLVQA